MKIQSLTLALAMLLTAFCSCNTGTTTGSPDADSTAKANEPDTVMLPDTAYASADDIVYEIELADTLTDGRLNDLRDPYDTVPGIFTFRGGHCRDARYFSGKVKGVPRQVVLDWEFTTSAKGQFGGGTGWTGQPLYVKWDSTMIARFKQESPALTADFGEEEILVGSLCGELYCLNFNTGKLSREPLDLGNTIKGTMSLDPALNGSLYAGQGWPIKQPFGHMAIDLFSHQVKYFMGRDPKAKRAWGGHDSSGIVAGQFLFWPSENGTIYKYERLGNGELKLHSALRYVVKGDRGAGVESSIAVFKNYGYFGDNHGDILCINLNTMRPVWHYDNHDDIDGTIVIEMENGVPYLYCGCEVDLQGGSDARTHFVKLNGLNGTPVWEWSNPSRRSYQGDKHFDGGLYCTPLLGDGNCKGMIFASFNQLDGNSYSEFLAFDTKTGNVLYRKPLHFYAWSSPIGFYNERDELFIVIGNSSGHLYLFNGKTGEMINDQVMASNFESSPIVKDNMFVVGSRNNKISRFHLE